MTDSLGVYVAIEESEWDCIFLHYFSKHWDEWGPLAKCECLTSASLEDLDSSFSHVSSYFLHIFLRDIWIPYDMRLSLQS